MTKRAGISLMALMFLLIPPTSFSAPKETTKVTMAQALNSLTYAPIYVAMSKGFFAKEGIEVDLQTVQGDAAVEAALAGGSAQFGSVTAAGLVNAVVKGFSAIGVFGTANRMTMDITVTKKLASAKNLSAQSSEAEVVRALKGTINAVTSLGGAPDRYTRWLMKKNGFSVDDVQIARIGGMNEILAALKSGTVDAFMLSPPAGPQAELGGYGVTVLPSYKVPEFKIFSHEVMEVTNDYLKSNPETVRKVVRALAMASDFIEKDPQGATRVLKKYFEGFSEDMIRKSLVAMEGAFIKQGRMTKEGWNNTLTVMYESGAIPSKLDPGEGTLWTNRFFQ